MENAVVQWAIIFVFVLFLPFSYWQAIKTSRVHIIVKIGSYLGSISIGAIIAVVFVAAGIIGPGPIFILIAAIFVISHHFALKNFQNKSKHQDDAYFEKNS